MQCFRCAACACAVLLGAKVGDFLSKASVHKTKLLRRHRATSPLHLPCRRHLSDGKPACLAHEQLPAPYVCVWAHFYVSACCTEFVGCSPSLSGAIRVNPWSVESVSDGMYAAIRMPLEHRRLRHEKHWKYVSQHTVAYWSSSYITDLVVSEIIHHRFSGECGRVEL